MKNEYQKDEDRLNGGPVPAQHVLCPSRAPGSPYVQSSVYTTPDGYHGSGEQAGTMSHYECKQSTAQAVSNSCDFVLHPVQSSE